MDSKTPSKIWEGLGAAILAFVAAGVIALLVSAQKPVFPVEVPGVQGFVETRVDLAWIGGLLLIGAVVWMIVSRARFFVLGSTILGGEAGFHFFDLVNIRIPLPNGERVIVEVSRNTDWRVHLALVAAAVFFVWIDHKRRPAA